MPVQIDYLANMCLPVSNLASYLLTTCKHSPCAAVILMQVDLDPYALNDLASVWLFLSTFFTR